MRYRSQSLVLGLIFTLTMLALATILRVVASPILGARGPFISFYAAVILCAWYGGLRQGLLATAAGATIAWYVWIPPSYTFTGKEPTAVALLITFLSGGTLISFVAESLHRARRSAEEKEAIARRKEDEFRITLSSIGDAVISTDRAGCIAFMNCIAESLTGWKQDDALGKPLSEIFPRIDSQTGERVRDPIQEVIESGVVQGLGNTVLMAKDGTERPIDMSAAPIRESENNLVGAIIVFRDISERKNAEAALRQANQQLHLITDTMSALVTRCSRDLTYVWVSKPYADWLGRLPDEITSHSIRDVIGEDAFGQLSPYFAQVLSGEVVSYEEQVNFRGIGPRWINAVYKPTYDSAREVNGWVAVVSDIDDKKRMAIELEQSYKREQDARALAEQANRLKDEFLAIVSHELRSPLNGMLGWAKLLQSGRLNPEESIRAIDTIERNIKVQSKLIEELLDVSRIIAGTIRLDVGSVNVNAILESAVESIRPAAVAKKIRIQVATDPGVPPVFGDPQRLEQIVSNLLSNAVKFTSEGGHVEVMIRSLRSQVEIVVMDTGQGIDPDFLPFVFDKFKQASTGAARNKGGLGLGLAIVRHLVELHGGNVQAESDGIGKGATFRVHLPLAFTNEGQSTVATPDTQSSFEFHPLLDGIRLLVLDDSADARELMGVLLRGCSATVYLAESAAIAREILAANSVDLILSDIEMPEEDGYTFIRSVRNSASTKKIPAIALTAYARPEDRAKALRAGFQYHLPKPVEPSLLIATVASMTAAHASAINKDH